MVSNEMKTYGRLRPEVKSGVLALSILIDRIGSLPKGDRADLFELLQEWSKTDEVEEKDSLHRAMEEILAQIPVSVRSLPAASESPDALRSWAEHVGGKIKQLRAEAEMSQQQLAEKAGLPQSHISRIENAQHSATHRTLQKIARALGVKASKIDPNAD
ncbi:MAG TPA: XRE family transcriptional regulator [Planctomycetales bacterium]|jgi:ribosome-binding protein aMBF1 (putative translation factor)|nr:XRE family transcriptional regulator [Planctomycetales bacterium]